MQCSTMKIYFMIPAAFVLIPIGAWCQNLILLERLFLVMSSFDRQPMLTVASGFVSLPEACSGPQGPSCWRGHIKKHREDFHYAELCVELLLLLLSLTGRLNQRRTRSRPPTEESLQLFCKQLISWWYKIVIKL